MNRANLGHTGEAVAAKYYIRQGYLLLNHNYRTRMGELDLILYKADTIVFAEVKTRTSAQRAAPAEAVDYYKQQRLIAAAGQYLQQSPYADANIRFDVVEVLPAGSGWQVHCIRLFGLGGFFRLSLVIFRFLICRVAFLRGCGLRSRDILRDWLVGFRFRLRSRGRLFYRLGCRLLRDLLRFRLRHMLSQKRR